MVKHLKCDTVYYVTPREFMRGKNRCNKCINHAKGSKTKPFSYYEEKINNILGSEYHILDFEEKYTGRRSRKFAIILHFKCGKVYKERIDHILAGRTCGCIREIESYGEERIENFLNANSILFESPKLFNNLKDKRHLHYDFYLPEYNMLIEYQGVQHYDPSHQLSGKKNAWELQKYHDLLKKNYAITNKYNFVEIPYMVHSQEEINKHMTTLLKIYKSKAENPKL